MKKSNMELFKVVFVPFPISRVPLYKIFPNENETVFTSNILRENAGLLIKIMITRADIQPSFQGVDYHIFDTANIEIPAIHTVILTSPESTERKNILSVCSNNPGFVSNFGEILTRRPKDIVRILQCLEFDLVKTIFQNGTLPIFSTRADWRTFYFGLLYTLDQLGVGSKE